MTDDDRHFDMMCAISDEAKVAEAVIAVNDAAYRRGYDAGLKQAPVVTVVERILLVILGALMAIVGPYLGALI